LTTNRNINLRTNYLLVKTKHNPEEKLSVWPSGFVAEARDCRIADEKGSYSTQYAHLLIIEMDKNVEI
jgi:hypothetical protein